MKDKVLIICFVILIGLFAWCGYMIEHKTSTVTSHIFHEGTYVMNGTMFFDITSINEHGFDYQLYGIRNNTLRMRGHANIIDPSHAKSNEIIVNSCDQSSCMKAYYTDGIVFSAATSRDVRNPIDPRVDIHSYHALESAGIMDQEINGLYSK